MQSHCSKHCFAKKDLLHAANSALWDAVSHFACSSRRFLFFTFLQQQQQQRNADKLLVFFKMACEGSDYSESLELLVLVLHLSS